MFSRKADVPLAVHVPSLVDDHPSWAKVSVIAAIGFIVGVAWPRLAGVRLGPAVPEGASTAASAPTAASEGPASVVASALPTPTAVAPAAVASATPVVASAPLNSSAIPEHVVVSVGHGTVFACSTSSGDALKGNACGNLPGLDSAVMPRLRKLADCPDAAGISGKLHLVMRVDFGRNALGVDLGRTPGVSSSDALLTCARSAVAGASLANISHDNPRYSVAYSVGFGAGATGATPQARPADSAAADGTAQVVWEVALVRDVPKTGKVIARLQRGVSIHVGAMKDGWFPVKYGDSFASDGWVYRGAIGK